MTHAERQDNELGAKDETIRALKKEIRDTEQLWLHARDEAAELAAKLAAVLAIAEMATSAAERRATMDNDEPGSFVYDARQTIDAIRAGTEFADEAAEVAEMRAKFIAADHGFCVIRKAAEDFLDTATLSTAKSEDAARALRYAISRYQTDYVPDPAADVQVLREELLRLREICGPYDIKMIDAALRSIE